MSAPVEIVSAAQLERIMYHPSVARSVTRRLVQRFVGPINEALVRYQIVTPARIAAFLAQVGHESGRLQYVREIWGPTPAQRGYEGRADLGNTEPGDGRRFMGRGLIQITGRANYQRMSDALGFDFIGQPEALESSHYAALSAGEFWRSRNLNALADAGDFDRITARVNGGQNGRADRRAIFTVAGIVLLEAGRNLA